MKQKACKTFLEMDGDANCVNKVLVKIDLYTTLFAWMSSRRVNMEMFDGSVILDIET